MDPDKQKEQFNIAYMYALGAHAGLNPGSFIVDDDSLKQPLISPSQSSFAGRESVVSPVSKRTFKWVACSGHAFKSPYDKGHKVASGGFMSCACA